MPRPPFRLVALLLACLAALSAAPARADWQATLGAARGQTVYWHAWGGDQRTNDFIAWVGAEAMARAGASGDAILQRFYPGAALVGGWS